MTAERPLRDVDYQLLAQFRYALRVFLRFSEEASRAAGISPHQHQLLLAIRGSPTPPSIGEVAECLQLQHHSTVELVNRAVDAGLVTRGADPRDRRRQRLGLTAAGDRLLARLSAVHRDELRRFRGEMSDLLRELA